MKYVKKAIVVDAWKVTDLINRFANNGVAALPEPVADAYLNGTIDFPTGFIHHQPERLDVITLEGIMTAHHGWWLVQGTRGEFYPVRADAFADTFTPYQPPAPLHPYTINENR